jgi:Flp pilus assembly protein TadG
MSRSARSERGAILIQVAITLLGLALFSALVIDYGVLWTSRRQAQNSADAGALAAAIHLLYNATDTPGAVESAHNVAHDNAVWGEAPAAADVLVQTDLTCPPGSGGGPGCVRVQVNRGTTDLLGNPHTNVLPTYFANIAGITSQRISAVAMAQVYAGNAVSCIKPWIVADKWQDTTPDTDPAPYNDDSWDRDDTFDPAAPDTYDPDLGFNPTHDTGYQMPLKPGNIGTWSAGWAMEIDFLGGGGCPGSQCYKDNIEGCPDWVPTVGIFNPAGYAAAHPGENCDAQNDTADPARGCLSVKTGMSQGPTSQGVNDLVALDSDATWVEGDNPATLGVTELGYVSGGCMADGSCVDNLGNPQSISPRIVPIAIFNSTGFIDEGCSGTGCVAQVVKLAGFFIEGMCSDVYTPATRPTWCGSNSDAQKIVIGRFMDYPGQWTGEGGSVTNSFAQAVRLVR